VPALAGSLLPTHDCVTIAGECRDKDNPSKRLLDHFGGEWWNGNLQWWDEERRQEPWDTLRYSGFHRIRMEWSTRITWNKVTGYKGDVRYTTQLGHGWSLTSDGWDGALEKPSIRQQFPIPDKVEHKWNAEQDQRAHSNNTRCWLRTIPQPEPLAKTQSSTTAPFAANRQSVIISGTASMAVDYADQSGRTTRRSPSDPAPYFL